MKSIQLIKNNIMAIVASLAIIGFSSFKLMNTEKASSATADSRAAEPALFWHEVDENGELGPLLNLDPNVAQTKTESMLGGAKQITNCDDSTPDPCLRGYDTPQNVGDPAGTPPSADYRINQH